ncbi:MAG TPA: hypothetical protein DHW82_01730 [Spirochaetia bacterium]|nr:MAG: hypothetical protein A2Y41_13775 [Spirochaetes bacterium GWB1_36_13]HCL55715.1 hypothetical protein [Spirochaetia bacterium]
MINDQEIKNLISQYASNPKTYIKIKEILSEFIYHFPSIGFEVYDEDIKGDFYLYLCERLEKIISDYKIQESAQFKTFFYLVLRRHYLNFIQSRKKNFKTLPIEEAEKIIHEPEENKNLEKISLLFASLTPFQRLILKLRCPDFLMPEDFFELGKFFNKPPSELFSKIDIILEDIRKKEEKRTRILSSKKQSQQSEENIPVASPKAIALFLGVKPNNVSKWLLEIKKTAKAEKNVS